MHSDTRRKVAEEAARLIYNGTYSEFKQAKEAAASSLGVRSIPSNFEVALELDQLSDRLEGTGKQDRLVELRQTAQNIMRLLEDFNPKLTGSVWRGTARKSSDIDINVYTSNSEEVINKLIDENYILRIEEITAVHRGRPIRSTHIHIDRFNAEIVIRPVEEREEVDRCETYGDLKKGLTLEELTKTLENDPTRKFVPTRRYT